jgi:hypothetical protein
MSVSIRILAVVWGFVWAICLQYTTWGKWLAVKRTWLTVVIGVGVDLLILWRVLDRRAWWQVAEVISLSAIGIIFRSLVLEHNEDTGGL